MNRLRVGKAAIFGAQIVFVIVASVFIEWMQNYASGNVDASFDFSILASWWRWVVVVAQTILAVYIVNMIITYSYAERKTRTTSQMCAILKTNELRIDKIYNEKMLPELDEAVKRVNEKAKKECHLRHMRKINTRITQEDIDNIMVEKDADKLENAIKNFKRAYCVTGVNEKRFDKAVSNLLSGKFTDYEIITTNELLVKGTFDRSETRYGIKDRRAEVRGRQLIKKAAQSVATASALGIIIAELVIEFSIISAMANGIYILMAILSGIFSAFRYCIYVEGLFDRRNTIFSKELGINDTWNPATLQEPDSEDTEL